MYVPLDARCCDAGSGVSPPDAVTLAPGRVSRLSPCVSQSLRSDARCCDAGSGWCLALVSLPVCSRMPDAVTPAGPSLCLPLVSQSCLSVSGCCDAGPGLVSMCLALFLVNKYRDIRQLLAQLVCFLDKQIYWDMRLIALLRIL